MYSLCYYFLVTSFYILLSPTNSRDLRICANWVWRIFSFEYEFVTVVDNDGNSELFYFKIKHDNRHTVRPPVYCILFQLTGPQSRPESNGYINAYYVTLWRHIRQSLDQCQSLL